MTLVAADGGETAAGPWLVNTSTDAVKKLNRRQKKKKKDEMQSNTRAENDTAT